MRLSPKAAHRERLGWLYLRQAKLDNAADIFSQVLALYPRRGRALDGMARYVEFGQLQGFGPLL